MKGHYRNHRSRWTLTELRTVERHYGKLPTLDLARRLGRTVNAVKCAASLLGLTGTCIPWTDSEIAVLRCEYARGDGITQVMALLPGRTRNTIFQKARDMGITSARGWSEYECRMLEQHYPLMGSRMATMIGRTREAVKIKASTMGLQVKGVTKARKWSEAELHLLADNQYRKRADIYRLFPDRSPGSIDKARANLKKRDSEG